MTRKLFVVNYSIPCTNAKRQVFVLAPNGQLAAQVADSLTEPGEKVSLVEAHEPVFDINEGGAIGCLYEGLAAPAST